MKESLGIINNKCIFRETFNSFDAIEKNGGTLYENPTAITINNGIATSVYSENKIIYGNLNKFLFKNKTMTVRVRIKPLEGQPSGNNYIVGVYNSVGDQRSWAALIQSDGRIRMATTTDGTSGGLNACTTNNIIFNAGQATKFYDLVYVFEPSGGKMYVDGNSVSVNGGIDTFAYDSTANFEIALSISADFDLVEIYEGELTVNEISLLSNNKSYKDVKDSGLIPLLKYDFVKNRTNFDEAGNAVAPTDTDTSYLKQGLYSNGSTTAINTNLSHADLDLTGDLIIEIIATPSIATTFTPYIYNGKLRVYSIVLGDGNERLAMTRDLVSFAGSIYGVVKVNISQHFLFISPSSGATAVYVDGVDVTNNDTGGVGTAGNTNLILFNSTIIYNRGIAKVVNVYQGLMTSEQVTQRYQYWKQKGYL